MTFKEFWEIEKYVALHAQTTRFRVIKYIVILVITFLVYGWKGWGAVGYLFAIMFIFGLGVHFLFRYKTKVWKESWGPYKALSFEKKKN